MSLHLSIFTTYLLLCSVVGSAQTAAETGSTILQNAAGHSATSYAHKAIDNNAALTRIVPGQVWKAAAAEVFGGKLNPVLFGLSLGMKVTPISTSSDRTMNCQQRMTPKGAFDYWSSTAKERQQANDLCTFSKDYDIGFEKYMTDLKHSQIKSLKESFQASCQLGYKKETSLIQYENKDSPGKVSAAYKNHSIKIRVQLSAEGSIQSIFATIVDGKSQKEEARFFVGADGIVSRQKALENSLRSKTIYSQSPTTKYIDNELFKEMLQIELVRIKTVASDLKSKVCSHPEKQQAGSSNKAISQDR